MSFLTWAPWVATTISWSLMHFALAFSFLSQNNKLYAASIYKGGIFET